MRTLLVIAAAALLAACALKNTALYGSDTLAPGERAIVSALGVYNDRDLRMQVTAINGEEVDLLKTASFIVPSGTYRIKVYAVTAVSVGHDYQGLTYSRKTANAEVTLTVRAGHTYIPNGVIRGARIQFFFDDAGLDFPTECLPLYVAVNASDNPGHALYRTDKKCTR